MTYRERARVLLPLAFALNFLVVIANGLLASSWFLLPATAAIEGAAATLFQGMVVGLIREGDSGSRDRTIRELIDTVRPVVLPLIGAGLLSGIAIGIGMLLLVVPGLILLTIWAVIGPVIVVERRKALASFGRSRELVEGNGWQVFLVVFVALVISTAATIGLSLIVTEAVAGLAVWVAVGLIAYTLTEPITALVAAAIYFRLLPAQDAATLDREPTAMEPPLAS